MFACGVIRRYGRANSDTAILGNLRCDVANAPDVDVSMLLGEAEFGRQVFSNQIAIEQGHGASSGLQEFRQQDICDGRLAGSGKPGEENSYALLVSGRETAAQLGH